MTRLAWGNVGERVYEAGVDRGVLYVAGSDGVSWNGLVSITETPTGGDSQPFYLDGVKYLNSLSMSEFEATLQAFTYPDEFAQCDGTQSIGPGFLATNQRQKPFNLVYRSKVGNDVDGVDHAYKIHILYDVLASPTDHPNNTLSGDNHDPINFSWKLTAKPSIVEGFTPTAHFILDSREVPDSILQDIENLLYGTDVSVPRLPSISELIFIFESYSTDTYDAEGPTSPYFQTIDGGSPDVEPTDTADGGTP